MDESANHVHSNLNAQVTVSRRSTYLTRTSQDLSWPTISRCFLRFCKSVRPPSPGHDDVVGRCAVAGVGAVACCEGPGWSAGYETQLTLRSPPEAVRRKPRHAAVGLAE